MTVFALLGAKALWLLYSWLASAIVASYLSGRKGYGERPGLASGLLLNVIGVDHLAVRAGARGLAVEEGRAVRARRRQAAPRGDRRVRRHGASRRPPASG